MSETRLRDKLLQILVDAHPNELRFSDLYERAGNPSRSVFSSSLRYLEKQGLATRREISYRYVTYILNIENYKKMLEKKKEELENAERRLKQ